MQESTKIEKMSKWNESNYVARPVINNTPPSFPVEFMVKIFKSPSYLSYFAALPAGRKVLDVGCGSGNNLRFFLENGLEGYGVEINESMIGLCTKNLMRLGLKAQIAQGTNSTLPYPDETFDIVTSINTIHYEDDLMGAKRSLSEFRRVLKPGGRVFIVSAGPRHDIRRETEFLGNKRYIVKNYDFRSGDVFTFFDDQMDLKRFVENDFTDVEAGTILEEYPKARLEFLFAHGFKMENV